MDTSSLAVIVGHWKRLEAAGGTLLLAGRGTGTPRRCGSPGWPTGSRSTTASTRRSRPSRTQTTDQAAAETAPRGRRTSAWLAVSARARRPGRRRHRCCWRWPPPRGRRNRADVIDRPAGGSSSAFRASSMGLVPPLDQAVGEQQQRVAWLQRGGDLRVRGVRVRAEQQARVAARASAARPSRTRIGGRWPARAQRSERRGRVVEPADHRADDGVGEVARGAVQPAEQLGRARPR